MSIRLDPDVKAALEALATYQERSLSWVTNRALRQWVETHRAEVEAAAKKAPRTS